MTLSIVVVLAPGLRESIVLPRDDVQPLGPVACKAKLEPEQPLPSLLVSDTVYVTWVPACTGWLWAGVMETNGLDLTQVGVGPPPWRAFP